jgi:hypothetical protein
MQSSAKQWLCALGVLALLTAGSARAQTQGALRQVYSNDGGGTAITDLEADPNYPDKPSFAEIRPNFEAPTNFGDSYGQRMGAILTPDRTDDYTFWIASDDNGSLRLSTNDDPKNAVEIATVSDWTNPREWTKFDTQVSAPVHLVAGQKYYIEALEKEGGGGDDLAVTWDHDSKGAPGDPIDGKFLTPLAPAGSVAPTAVTDLKVTASDTGSGTMAFSVPSVGAPSFYSVYYSPYPITADNLSQAASIGALLTGGGTQTVTIAGLQPIETYYAAVVTGNASGLLGGLSNVVSFTTGEVKGALLEAWNNISGTAVSDLENDPRYPDTPDTVTVVTSFEAPTNWGDNYGQRIRGFLTPDKTDDYEFWIASDDNGSLRLSTDDDPANAVEIASVGDWTNSREWTKFDTQASGPIHLVGGKKYYIEAVQKEGGGGDDLAVTWSTANADAPGDPISFRYLSLPIGDQGRLSGVVTNENGLPLSGVMLSASAKGSATTDSQGRFTMLTGSGANDITLTQGLFNVTDTIKGVNVITNQQVNQTFILKGGLAPVGKVSLRSADLAAAGNPGWSYLVFPDSTLIGDPTAPDADALKIYADPTLPITGTDKTTGSDWIIGWGPIPGDREPADHADPQPNDIPDNSYWAQAVKVKVPADVAKSGVKYTVQDFNVDDYATMVAVNGDNLGGDVTGNYAKVWSFTGPITDIKADGSDNLITIIGYEGGGGAGMSNDNGGPNLVIWGLGTGGVTPPPTGKLGDLNGDGAVNVQDATLSLRIAVGLLTPTDAQKAADDANHDGKWNVQDATLILRAAVGLGTLS